MTMQKYFLPLFCLTLMGLGADGLTVQHKGEECWNDGCGGGLCDWCGQGACCRNGWNQGNGCDGSNGCADGHCCTLPAYSRPIGGGATTGCGTRKVEDNVQLFSVPSTGYIVGGRNAKRGSLPWQVSIGFQDHFCGGTIINKRWILTAAHCLVGIKSLGGLNVVAGEQTLNRKEGSEQEIYVERTIVHPRYKRGSQDNDIALLKLSKDLYFGDYIQPACLPSLANEKRDYARGSWAIISGWGNTRANREGKAEGNYPSTLQVATVPFISDSTCKRNYGYGYITNSMVCAGKVGVGGTDACQGDSGGPLVKKIDGKFTVLGVVSWGIGCARPDKPGVYTRVARFRSWIKDTVARY